MKAIRFSVWLGYLLGVVMTWFVLQTLSGQGLVRQNFADEGKCEWEGY